MPAKPRIARRHRREHDAPSFRGGELQQLARLGGQKNGPT
jgi:hypothetical protein